MASDPVTYEGPVASGPGVVLRSRPIIAIGLLVAAAAALELIPGLERYRLLDRVEAAPSARAMAPPIASVGEARIDAESTTVEAAPSDMKVKLPKAQGPIAGRRAGKPLPKIDFEKPPLPIVDKGFRGLAPFYEHLAKTARKEDGAITRVVHFGDSIVTSDLVSGTLRRRFQKHFGDAGHGYMLLASAWPAYSHWDTYRFSSKGWRVRRIVGPLAEDGIYGIGCVSFRGVPGCRARLGTSRKTNYGRKVSRFLVSYYRQPGGGTFQLNVDGEEVRTVSTDAPEAEVAVERVDVPDGEHMLEYVNKQGSTRAFGVVMEREGPGVVWDAIGVQGARVRFLDKQDDDHWAAQLKWRDPSLLVYQFGANESGDGFAYSMEDYHRTLVDVLKQGKQAVPDAGCLVIGVMDRAEKRGGSTRTMPVIPALVKEQRLASAEIGCAFFNTYEAMGGPGSMASWVSAGLGQPDLTHPSGAGAQILGTWIYRALLQGFDAYRRQGNTPSP